MDVAEPIPRTALAPEVLRAALSAVESGRRAVVATVVARHGSAPSTPGQKLALFETGAGDAVEAIGTIGGGAVERVILASMVGALRDSTSQPRLETFRLGPSLGMCCGGSVDILIEPLRPASVALVIGAGHVGVALAPMLAAIGFQVTLCDAREHAASAERVAALGAPETGAVRILHAEHDDPSVLTTLGADPSGAAAVVMTHDHQLDQAAIEWALAKGFAFIGGVGSRAKATRTRARLAAKNVSAADIARVRMPIGVDIGARTPAEIAVAITAELIAWRAGHRAERASAALRSANEDAAPPESARLGAGGTA